MNICDIMNGTIMQSVSRYVLYIHTISGYIDGSRVLAWTIIIISIWKHE